MKASVINELAQHIEDLKADGVLTEENREVWRDIAFNHDYYIMGYYQAEQWLKRHQISAWEAIEYVQEQEREMFGGVVMKNDNYNAEYVANALVYFAGMEAL